MELIFLVDGSNSVGYTSFDKMKAWIGDFIKNFDLSESTTRVGLVQYSDRISTRNGFQKWTEKYTAFQSKVHGPKVYGPKITQTTKSEKVRNLHELMNFKLANIELFFFLF